MDKKNVGFKLSKERNLIFNCKKYYSKFNYKINKHFRKLKITFIVFYSFLSFLLIFLKINNSNYVFPNDIDCIITKNKFKNRNQPLDFVNEFLFFTDLISCKIPFSFIRFGDVMKGIKIKSAENKWHWNPQNKNLQDSLIESSSICTNDNSFIGIQCKDWINV